ncbi:hypothetical protein AB5I41_17055 [Sphingomonas sp. MMS24-JH45]
MRASLLFGGCLVASALLALPATARSASPACSTTDRASPRSTSTRVAPNGDLPAEGRVKLLRTPGLTLGAGEHRPGAAGVRLRDRPRRRRLRSLFDREGRGCRRRRGRGQFLPERRAERPVRPGRLAERVHPLPATIRIAPFPTWTRVNNLAEAGAYALRSSTASYQQSYNAYTNWLGGGASVPTAYGNRVVTASAVPH